MLPLVIWFSSGGWSVGDADRFSVFSIGTGLLKKALRFAVFSGQLLEKRVFLAVD
jgi:hypothetical protein